MESITSITFPEAEKKTDYDDLNEFEVCLCIFFFFGQDTANSWLCKNNSNMTKRNNIFDNDIVSTKAYLCNKYRLSKSSVIHNY